MAAPTAHHTHYTQDSNTPLDLQQPPALPQAHRADRPSASSSTRLATASTSFGLEQTPPPPLTPRKLSRTRHHSSRRVPVASNQIRGLDTGGIVVRGEPVTMEELRWERAKFIKRKTRRWRVLKEGLGFIVLSWTIYQTIRYFVAYSSEPSPQVDGHSLTLARYFLFSLRIISVYNEDTIRTRFNFALGLLSGLGMTLLIIYKVFDYLVRLLDLATSLTLTLLHIIQPRDHILIKRFLFFIVYLSSLCIFAIALINAILVPIWRYGTPSEPFSVAHSLQGRCKWDVDVIWTGTGNQCRRDPAPYGAFVAAAVTRTVLTAGLLVAFHLAQRQYAIAARSRRSNSATRLMSGKAESALHPSTSRLSSAPTVDATSPNFGPAQRGKGSPSGTIATLSPILSPTSITSPLSSHLSTPNVKSPLPAVPEMTEAEPLREPSPLVFGKRTILGGPRWPDDPSGIESPEPTPGSEQPPLAARVSSPGTSSHTDRVGYFGHQGRETPSDTSEGVDDETTWQADFRGLMQSLAADGASSSHVSEVQQRVLAQLQAMGAPMNPGDLWNREVLIMGGVVRRMSTIESIGSGEREPAPDGASEAARTGNSPSPVEVRCGSRGSRPPSRPPSGNGTAATGSTAASSRTGSQQNTRAGTGDSQEPRSDS